MQYPHSLKTSCHLNFCIETDVKTSKQTYFEHRCLLNQFVTVNSGCVYPEWSKLTVSSSFSYRFKLFLLPPGRQSGKLIQISELWQRHTAVCLCLLVVLMITLFCPVSITTWWWLPQQLHLPQPQKITTFYSTVFFPTAPPQCYGSSQAHPGAAHWQPPMEAAIVAAPVVWCPPAVCGTATKTESETETETATPSQDCRGPQWKLQRRPPFMAPYLTLSLLTRSTLN